MKKGALKTKTAGRPRLAETKATTVGIRLSERERTLILKKAQSAGLRMTTYIRQVIIDAKVRPRLSEEERFFVRQLVGQSNNLNQVAKVCHEQGFLKGLTHFEKIRSQVDQIIEKLTR